MSDLGRRIVLITLFLIVSYFITIRQNVHLVTTVRESRYREKYSQKLEPTHLGPLSQYRLNQKYSIANPSLLNWIGFDKKINTYQFTFYNWYHFQLSFVDLTYDSYIEFKSFSEQQLHDTWTHHVGFTLQDSFYPQGGRIKMPKNPNSNCSCCKCPKERGLNLDINTNVFNLTVRQYTIKNQSDDRHDGYKYSRFWYYTPNKTLNESENNYFKSDLTITTFNFSYKGQTRRIQGNMTHILRHNQCFSFVDQQNSGTFKHKCYGGYSGGRLFIDKKIQHEELKSFGKWVKSAYNLDFNRSRAFFQGARSTKKLYNSLTPVSNWHWKQFKVYMQCFSKPEYYQKGQNIEKERYVGLHFSRSYAPSQVQNMQDYIFFNGKIHPIHNIDYKFNEKYQINSNITFRGVPAKNIYQPEFQANFTILSVQKLRHDRIVGERNELRAYGYWSGYFDQGQNGKKYGFIGERVEFFNISGYIHTSNSLY